MTLPASTYRLQFREGMDFDRAAGIVPYLADLGIGALYAAPLFTASTGSTHGYDVTDPTEIDPTLGGIDGLRRLSAALKARGMGLILDIVPNHMAFGVETPWIRDVMRNGVASPYSRHFDFDLSAERLRLPWLGTPFEQTLHSGDLSVGDDPDGPVLIAGGLRIPLATTAALDEARTAPSVDALRRLHDEQPWRLVHWRTEADILSHRRFFSVTGLIGVRVEDPRVFEDTHALLFDLVEDGIVTGIRIDHIDGLADPTAYLAQLRDRVGDTPIWVEKILTGDERLPDWDIQGTTGYEIARALNRVLTDAAGLEVIETTYRERTGRDDPFRDVLARAKRQIVTRDLAAELWTLHRMVSEIATRDPVAAELGPEMLREAVIALVVAFPRYRIYPASGPLGEADAAFIDNVADAASDLLQDDTAVRFIARVLIGGDPAAAAFRTRFQQVTGAAMAKSLEDTAFYREVRLLSLNEVGGEPDDSALSIADFHATMADRARDMPHGLTLTSSHDTKRSEDARMRIAAITGAPEAFLGFHAACADAAPDAIRDNLVWYMSQTLLAIAGTDDVAPRLRQHLTKALREAKRDTFWTAPDTRVEGRAHRLADRLVDRFDGSAERLAPVIDLGARLSLIQAALKLTVPGIPDVYQGCEIASYRLTDPDNRAPVDFAGLSRALSDPEGLATPLDREKFGMTRALLGLRQAEPDLFLAGDYIAQEAGPGVIQFRRTHGAKTLTVRACVRPDADPDTDAPALPGRAIWPVRGGASAVRVSLDG